MTITLRDLKDKTESGHIDLEELFCRPGVHAVTVDFDSMVLAYRKGDILIVETGEEPKVGQPVLIEMPDGNCTVTSFDFHLVSVVIGVVLGMVRSYRPLGRAVRP